MTILCRFRGKGRGIDRVLESVRAAGILVGGTFVFPFPQARANPRAPLVRLCTVSPYNRNLCIVSLHPAPSWQIVRPKKPTAGGRDCEGKERQIL